MAWQRRLVVGWKALTQLGWEQVGLNALYRFGLATGHYRRETAAPPEGQPALAQWLDIDRLSERLRAFYQTYPETAVDLVTEADEVRAGRARLFGTQAVVLNLEPPSPLAHWSAYERGQAATGADDLKFVWEPARFGWALALMRAYILSGDNGYAQSFWALTRHFLAANPPYRGPNWISGQEAGIRLIVLSLAGPVLSAGAEAGDESSLAQAIAAHAERIPPTLVYARSQHNNHLLTEAAGLLSAAAALPDHPSTGDWRRLGWKWLNHGLQTQIAPNGGYAQHSANYHRLMLQTALWGRLVAARLGLEYPAETGKSLAAATHWLARLVDQQSGRAANFGPNDGAYLLPLAAGGFADYRPTLQAAARAFLGGLLFPPGAWDEMSVWFGLEMEGPGPTGAAALHPGREQPPASAVSGVERLENGEGWALLRAGRFTSRPGHADQLHVEIWHGGQPIAQDAGTYRYTAAAPWENALASARVHNTVTVNDQEPMRRAGKFLWLDWDQAHWLETSSNALEAERDGYRHLGVMHRRRLEQIGTGEWLVTDRLLPTSTASRPHRFTLHWLLPDWLWHLEGTALQLEGPVGLMRVSIDVVSEPRIELIRAGESLLGPAAGRETLGWFSPTYNVKTPALSLCVDVDSIPPLQISTRFQIDK